MSYNIKLLVGFIGTAILVIFIGGLSYSISTGFAGFSGGFPFMIIAIIVCSAAIYDFWSECVRKK
ncbi:hypothetical protein N8Z38_04525 [Amylibacter sp.]|jgi:hypothetical protein|nr:hypothetical protein [Amylibacter sp.]MDA9329351.1 hypothetical protein [bacterium]MDA8853490.1 hypothetical protein [Amylibacter sp.]MDA8913554.1 hypothetical protein [Amylibacter sp.]MDA9005310.1 hypothetical protein [Amylibacter sp.]|tara:strand:+ start:593 stop:787 length:195 start_codon:yes stop_codon:yes gene_type:complete